MGELTYVEAITDLSAIIEQFPAIGESLKPIKEFITIQQINLSNKCSEVNLLQKANNNLEVQNAMLFRHYQEAVSKINV